MIFFSTLGFALAENEAKNSTFSNRYYSKITYIDIDEEAAQTKQEVEIKLKDGNLVLIDNILTGNPYYDIKLKKGIKLSYTC